VGGDVEVALPDGKSDLGLNRWSVGSAYGTSTSFASIVAASGTFPPSLPPSLPLIYRTWFGLRGQASRDVVTEVVEVLLLLLLLPISKAHPSLPPSLPPSFPSTGKTGMDYSIYGVVKTSPPLSVAGKLTYPSGGTSGGKEGGRGKRRGGRERSTDRKTFNELPPSFPPSIPPSPLSILPPSLNSFFLPSLAAGNYGVTLGGIYKCSATSTLKGKINMSGLLSTSIIHVRREGKGWEGEKNGMGLDEGR